MKPRHSRRWLNFYHAADEIVQRLAVSEGVAQRMLREACVRGDVGSQRELFDPVTGQGQAPPELVKPSEWGKDQVDLVTNADGCVYLVDVDADDFRYWLASAVKPKRSSRSQTLVLRAIAELGLPDDLPTPALQKRVCDWLTDHGSKAPSRDTILRATGRRR